MNIMQTNIFEYLYEPYKITKPIRLIELFAGYGSQSLALKYLGANYESWKICEWNYKSIFAYKTIHFENDKTDYSQDLTKEEIQDFLFDKGISSDWNKAMSLEQIKRLPEWELRRIYNNIIATHNLVDISKVGGVDLEIKDKEDYCYIMTYSFPCQDLSLAGKTLGMEEGSETRSSLLWQVGRILKELKDLDSLPQILLMENVPQVHGTGNIENFRKWQLQLEKLGYQNYWQDLKGTDYGIPQLRNRTFMVSIKNAYYEFPKPIPLEKRLKDLLEEEVDEKYYLTQKQIEDIQQWNAYEKPLETLDNGGVSKTLTTRIGAYSAGMQLTYDKHTLKEELVNDLLANNKVQEYDTIRHSYSNSRMNNFYTQTENNISPTLDTRADCIGVVINEDKKQD